MGADNDAAVSTPDPSAVAAGRSPSPAANTAAGKVAMQLKKIQENNNKYKNLLKMAKDRIQQQEDEIKRLRAEAEAQRLKNEKEERDAANAMVMEDQDAVGDSAEHSCNIVRICQRIDDDGDVWALIEFEVFNPDALETSAFMDEPVRRVKKWRKFETETGLSEFIKRDTGEPLMLPASSLTPHQSARIREEAERCVAQISEEFRRFRVRSELARKQADSQIRDLQNNNMETAKRRIAGQNVERELEQARNEHTQLERMRDELAQQEAQWKEAYDLLAKENKMLKSSGSEGLLASEWRQRYDACQKEKEALEGKLKIAFDKQAMAGPEGSDKYEAKYRDLKESFRLYRKKAKEMFDAQQLSEQGMLLPISERSSEESKMSYLKNLMVNYLTSDMTVREHMEGAIGTVLQFTPDDISRIEKKRHENDSWGIF